MDTMADTVWSTKGSDGLPQFPAGTNNRRPDDLIQLFTDRAVELTFSNTARLNRFYVVNIVPVMNTLKLRHTSSDTGNYFKRAKILIGEDKKWNETFDFVTFEAHPIQVNSAKRSQAKFLETAAVIIVAMEAAAKELRPALNVYNFLRILPAMHFIDRFDTDRYKALLDAFEKMPADEKTVKFGANAGWSFEDLCLVAMKQPQGTRLIVEMLTGSCVTRDAAEKLMAFVNANFDPALKIGPVRVSGEECDSRNLGTKYAAPELRVPSTTDIIPVCT